MLLVAEDAMTAAGHQLRAGTATGLWIERATLTRFRSHAAFVVEAGPEPVVLTGPNGAGKTNLIEALSLLVPGQGLRRAPFGEIAMAGGDGSWSVAARVHTSIGAVDIGTGQPPASDRRSDRVGRIVRVDGAPSSPAALSDYLDMVWVTPAMDGLFTGPTAERRRFLDRLILCFDHGHGRFAGRFEKAMQSRNRLLADGVRDGSLLGGFELQMAEAAVAMAAARVEAIGALAAVIERRRARDAASPFPWATIAIDGTLEHRLADTPALDVEDGYLRALRDGRERDRAAGRTLEGPHRSDLVVGHGPKAMPAALCSTGEQKSLLLGLVLAHAELIAERGEGAAPILLLDEITAHLDASRRRALFEEILRLGAQAWMTGNDVAAFSALTGAARFLALGEGGAREIVPDR